MADETPKSDEVKSACPADLNETLADATLSRLIGTLIAEIRGLRAEIQPLRPKAEGDVGTIATAALPVTALAPPDEDEMERRLNLSVDASYGRTRCQFCGLKSNRASNLKRHLRRRHAAKIAALPSSAFK